MGGANNRVVFVRGGVVCDDEALLEKYGERCVIVNEALEKDEHKDNQRVLRESEVYFGREIIRVRSKKYASVDEVFEQTRYMAGVNGARCSTEMKRIPGRAFADVADVNCFGYTVEEPDRIALFEQNNPELFVEWPLRDAGLTKDDCFRIMAECGVRRSRMYDEGFKNANCIGCVKVTSPPYWNRVRRLYPEAYESRAARSRELGVRLVQITINGVRERIFLDELRPDMGKQELEPAVSCGPFCSEVD